MDMMLIARLMMGAAALVCLWFIVKGLIDMQRINTSDSSVIETQGVVRHTTPSGRYDTEAVVTLNIGEEVHHVACLLPGPWLGKRRRRVTDIVRVYWRKGDKRAVAADTIEEGQKMFLVGFVFLVLTALMFLLL